jgi:hypothetical protein
MKSNGWSNTTIDQIWWDVHAKALKKLSFGKKRFIIKFIHNRLPSNYRQNKYYSYKDPICQICKLEIETQQHIIRCKGCENINKLRKNYLGKLTVYLEQTMTSPATKQFLINNVYNSLNMQVNINAITIAPDASNAFMRVSNKQNDIGWDQWFKGRLTREWGTLRNHDLQNPMTQTRYTTAEKWAVDMIIATLEYVHGVWLQRNKYEHDLDGDPVLRRKEKLIETIRGEYKENDHNMYSTEDIEYDVLKKCNEDSLKAMCLHIKNGQKGIN